MVWFRFNLFIFFLILLIEIHAKPFFKNKIRSITSSISFGSAPQDTESISDYRSRKSQKLDELSKFKNDDPFLDDEFDEKQAADDQERNEALPSLLQQKIAKIMNKLQFVTQLINTFSLNGNNSVDKNDDKNTDIDIDSEEIDSTANSTLNITERSPGNDIGWNIEEKEEIIEKIPPQSNENGKLQNNGGLGVYFMELLGSLFGLIYGATIQLTGSPKPSI